MESTRWVNTRSELSQIMGVAAHLVAPLILTAVLIFAGSKDGAAQQPERIIVSGASGQLGGLVVKELLARGVPPENLILVSRTPENLAEYAAMGASTRYGDFNEPESLDQAYAGGTRMLLISINTLERRPELHKNAIDAAVRAGVRHIVYTSFVDLDNNDSPLAEDHRRTEAFIRESGLTWTMLRNQLYMNNLLAQAATIAAAGRVVVPPNAPLTGYVTREDCAAAAAAVLATPGHENRVYDITGPAAIGPREIALAVREVTGIPIEIVEGDAAAGGRGGGMPGGGQGNAWMAVTSNAVAELTGRPATSVVEFLRANREAILPGNR